MRNVLRDHWTIIAGVGLGLLGLAWVAWGDPRGDVARPSVPEGRG